MSSPALYGVCAYLFVHFGVYAYLAFSYSTSMLRSPRKAKTQNEKIPMILAGKYNDDSSRISSSGPLWSIFNHKVLNVAQLRLRLCSIRSTKPELRAHSKITSHSEAALQHTMRRSADRKILKRALLFLRFFHPLIDTYYVTLSTHNYEFIFE